LHSRQFQHSRNAAVVIVAVVEAEALMVVAEASIPAVAVAASTEAVDLLAVAQAEFMEAASLAARGRSAVEVIRGATGLKPAAILGHWQITPRIFVPPSTMANGIRSATLVALV
jgi:hypothetical protein